MKKRFLEPTRIFPLEIRKNFSRKILFGKKNKKSSSSFGNLPKVFFAQNSSSLRKSSFRGITVILPKKMEREL